VKRSRVSAAANPNSKKVNGKGRGKGEKTGKLNLRGGKEGYFRRRKERSWVRAVGKKAGFARWLLTTRDGRKEVPSTGKGGRGR